MRDDNPAPPAVAAVAQLARDVGNALLRFAGSLEAGTPGHDSMTGLGPRQRAILALPALTTPGGMTTEEVADEIGYRPASTTAALQRLVELGHLEQLPEVRPAHWRRPAR